MQRIPTTVVTGFLGAGKTSLIRHLVAHKGDKRIALLINEFGDYGVDREIVTGCGLEGCDEGDVIELANGCICCTVADDFLPSMQKLLARDPAPDHIVIETSGLALPKPLIQAFAWPDVRARLTVDGVLVVADAPAIAAGRFAGDPEAVAAQREGDAAIDHETPLEELFEEQLGSADMVIVNKAEDVAPSLRPAIEAAIRRHLRPGVPLLWTAHGRIDPAVALGLGIGAEDDLESRHSHHDDGRAHDHDDFTSFVVELPEIRDPAALERHLAQTIRAFDLLRVKGFLAVDGKPMRHVVQAVGDRIERYYDRPWHAHEARAGKLVVITEHKLAFDPAPIAQALQRACA
ncbi:MAG: cobalamin biosynthesis protein CobW [Geminicoccaceae bacterium]|nr:MAG: cobalamin biosynthesis protein CobW [Geminicoccaceae bacterium]